MEERENKRDQEGEEEREEMLRFYSAQRLELLQENDDAQVSFFPFPFIYAHFNFLK